LQELVNQATLFYNSMTDVEKEHMVAAAQFELSKCEEAQVHQAAIETYNLIDHSFAAKVAEVLPHVKVPDEVRPNHGKKSAFLSQVDGKGQKFTAAGRKVGVYVLPGYDYTLAAGIKTAFEAGGIMAKIVSRVTGPVAGSNGSTLPAEFTFEVGLDHFAALALDCLVSP
jgi:catalase